MTGETEGPSSRAGPIVIILLRQGICLKTPVAMGKSMKFYTCGAYYPQRPLSREVGSWEHEVMEAQQGWRGEHAQSEIQIAEST